MRSRKEAEEEKVSLRHDEISFIGVDETAFAEGVSGSVPDKGVDGHSSFSGVDANSAGVRFSQIGEVPKPQSHLGTRREPREGKRSGQKKRLHTLKKNKSRDPNGWVNELF